MDRERIMGFTRRGALNGDGSFVYMVPLESCSDFHFVLTNAALLPAWLLDAYWSDSNEMAAARGLVDRQVAICCNVGYNV